MLTFRQLKTVDDFNALTGKEIFIVIWKDEYPFQQGLRIYPKWHIEKSPYFGCRYTHVCFSKHVYIDPEIFEKGECFAKEAYVLCRSDLDGDCP